MARERTLRLLHSPTLCSHASSFIAGPGLYFFPLCLLLALLHVLVAEEGHGAADEDHGVKADAHAGLAGAAGALRGSGGLLGFGGRVVGLFRDCC
jgi:hypothetical protein